MSLLALVTAINSDATANAVVDHIFNTFFSAAGETAYRERFFAQDVRNRLFDGGVINGREVTLSTRARLLKSAFQRRYVASGCTRFTPLRAYHITSSQQIAALIAKTGFRSNGGLYGAGAYFYGTSQAAEAYAAPVINGADGNPLPPVVLELTIFSRRATGAFPIGSDEVVFYRDVNDLYLVKNPLVIFPTAVFERGQKLVNTEVLVDL